METSKPPDVLFVIGGLGIGGTERHLLRVSRQLSRANWKVCIYSLAGDGPLRMELEAAGIKVILPPVDRATISDAVILRAMRFALAAMHLTYTMVRVRPRITHFFLPAAYIVGAIAASLTRIRLRVMSRRSLNTYQQAYPFVQRLEMKLHGGMDAILANSRAVIRELRDEEHVDSSRLGLIYNGIELPPLRLDHRAEVRSLMDIDDRTVVYIIVANLIPYKGHLDLITALGMANERINSLWHLLVVGRDDGVGVDIRALAKKLNIDDKISFLGERTDVASLLLASDVGLLCSHQEGFSNSIIEGMAAGLPMIVTDVGGNSEAVIDGQSGLVVPSHSPQELAVAIERLAKDPDLRVMMGNNARRRAQENFTLEACVARYQELYASLLAGRKPCEIDSIRPNW